jgi:hypothetical protein
MLYYPNASEFRVNVPVNRELLDVIDEARHPLRLSRAEFARRAFVAYCETVSRKASVTISAA